jgi:predicted transcriptional regulator
LFALGPEAALADVSTRFGGQGKRGGQMRKLVEFLFGIRELDAERTALEILQETRIEQLDEMVARLKKKRPAVEVCDAMTTLIERAPFSQFETLKYIYLRHFGA